jgi:arsenate reductase (thioredoxin)
MKPADNRVYRVLFLCTGNSARSQIAEALLNRKGRGRFLAESAGSAPAERVNPYAIQVLREHGLEWNGHQPRGLEGLERTDWDFVITVCDHAREACPIFPGRPVLAHWGMPDPATVQGFRESFVLLNRRIDLLLALPVDKLERLVLQTQVRAIGDSGLVITS